MCIACVAEASLTRLMTVKQREGALCALNTTTFSGNLKWMYEPQGRMCTVDENLQRRES